MFVEDHKFRGVATGRASVEALRHIVHENEKTKRLLIGAACLFMCVAAFLAVFAPQGKEMMSYIVDAALVIMSLGAIGMAQFKLELPGLRITAEHIAEQLDLSFIRSREEFVRPASRRSQQQ